MKKETLLLSHPILFVEDFGNPEVTIPEYTPESVVSANSSCISVRAIADVDGDVTVRLMTGGQEAPLKGFIRVFEGKVLTPNRKIAVVTAHNERVVETEVANVVTTVRISVNDVKFPDEVIVEEIIPAFN
jgi:hypothetical protein